MTGSEFHLHCPGGPAYAADFSVVFTCDAFTAPSDGCEVTPLFTCNVP